MKHNHTDTAYDDKTPLNQSDQTGKLKNNIDKSKKKKVVWGVVIAILIVGVILAIVLPLTLKSSGGGHTDAFLTQEYNPFTVDPKTIVNDKYEVSLTMNQAAPPKKLFSFEALFGDAPSGTSYKPVNPKDIPLGENNKLADQVQVNVQQVGDKVIRFLVQDPKDTRPLMSEDVFPRPAVLKDKDLKDIGF